MRQQFSIRNGLTADLSSFDYTINITAQDPPQPPVNPNKPGPNNPGGNGGNGVGIPDLFPDKVKIHFGTMNDSAEDYYYINKHDATTRGLGIADVDIQTQEKAQKALVRIKDAIVVKDKIRAEYGAMQNRLENTLANLNIQAENLQAAESRISDVDVATEMTNFVRNQILTQSAVAMLSQANSLPQMAMQLLGG